jgi:hypothetical protein
MDGINVLLSIIFLLLIAFIGLIRAQTVLGVFACFILLTLIAYMTIYMFTIN